MYTCIHIDIHIYMYISQTNSPLRGGPGNNLPWWMVGTGLWRSIALFTIALSGCSLAYLRFWSSRFRAYRALGSKF